MWSSEKVIKESPAKEALAEILRLAAKYEDATDIGVETEGGRSFLSWEIRFFRPSVKMWVAIVGLFCVAGGIRGWFDPELEFSEWTREILRIVVQVFVVGVSITTLARALSESAKFTAIAVLPTPPFKFTQATTVAMASPYISKLTYKVLPFVADLHILNSKMC